MQLDLLDWLNGHETAEKAPTRLRLVSNRRRAPKPLTAESALAQLELLFKGWDEETIHWTEDEIATVREALLRDALQTILDGRAADRTRSELWLWMMSDEVGPFSFRVCCQTVEVNWEEMRETFTTLAKRHGKHQAAVTQRAG